MLTNAQIERTTCDSRGRLLTCDMKGRSGAPTCTKASGLDIPGAPRPVSPSNPEDPTRPIDLSMVKRKLMDAQEGPGWTAAYVEVVEVRYRRFLEMVLKHPERSIVPTHDIDEMWHAHILDTRAYAQDCEAVFGYFVHHYPYFGMNGVADYDDLVSSFSATEELYLGTYGEEYDVAIDPVSSGPTRCGPQGCVKCGSGPVKCHHPRGAIE